MVEKGGKVNKPSDCCGDEELGTVSIFARVCHAQDALLAMLQLKVFIREFFSVDGLPTGT